VHRAGSTVTKRSIPPNAAASSVQYSGLRVTFSVYRRTSAEDDDTPVTQVYDDLAAS
jgi:hypothetical protein